MGNRPNLGNRTVSCEVYDGNKGSESRLADPGYEECRRLSVRRAGLENREPAWLAGFNSLAFRWWEGADQGYFHLKGSGICEVRLLVSGIAHAPRGSQKV